MFSRPFTPSYNSRFVPEHPMREQHRLGGCVSSLMTKGDPASGARLAPHLFRTFWWLCAFVCTAACLVQTVRGLECDLCADNWLFILAAGGRTASTTALSMFSLLPQIELAGEHAGGLEEQFAVLRRLELINHGSVAWKGPQLHSRAFFCVTQELVKTMVYGAGQASREPKTKIVGFKEIRYVSWHMQWFLASAFPCARIIFPVRQNASAEILVKSGFNYDLLHREWAEERKVAESIHKASPHTSFVLPIERVSEEMYN
ncbi:hypothetical protein FVE85_2254 [Porphyridium purpureum]|uniref:Uncharacterized protein n=1 Tax=Porphyridium purpureum TaxID=35688 RepID=A0A5J4YX08_PORPP|nr:hypothetical protein FVE85_2254 [Porphyridium purpureum]|eukprot:POR4022..scf209_3